ncbi:unnamed protein product [Closterium sp. Naga37s-1]|nr:unnamed protein product [Closterium sp. Naga37s-1]
MMVMGKLRHPNILRLLGACIADDQMAMIYEFIPCGDVHELLEDGTRGVGGAVRECFGLCMCGYGAGLLGACIWDDNMDGGERLERGEMLEGARKGKEEFRWDRGKVAMGCADALSFIHGQSTIGPPRFLPPLLTYPPHGRKWGVPSPSFSPSAPHIPSPALSPLPFAAREGKEEFKYEDRMEVAMGCAEAFAFIHSNQPSTPHSLLPLPHSYRLPPSRTRTAREGKEEFKYEDRMKVAMGSREGKEEFKYEDRMKVAMGCAEALAFIHGQEYVHRDFKAPNVLLAEGLSPRVADFGLARIVENWKDHGLSPRVADFGLARIVENWKDHGLSPRVADFGLARIVENWKDHVTTRHHPLLSPSHSPPFVPTLRLPTPGPLTHSAMKTRQFFSLSFHPSVLSPPGYLNEHCDTFAFGIFLIELATGHSVLEAKFDDVVNGAVRSEAVEPGAVMDPRLEGQWSEEQAKTLLGVAKVCITTDWDDRPTMDNVVEMMQGVMG